MKVWHVIVGILGVILICGVGLGALYAFGVVGAADVDTDPPPVVDNTPPDLDDDDDDRYDDRDDEDAPEGSLCPARTVVNAQNGLALPAWRATYGDASRTGDEEADTYPLYPHSAYLAVAAEFNGVTHAVHFIWVQADREHQFSFTDAEVIPVLYGEDLSSVWVDARSLAGYKAAVKGESSLPLYCWTVSPTGELEAGIDR